MPAPSSSTSLALTRVTRQLEKVTDELIRALFTQAREPSPARAQRIVELERERDQLHDRLDLLENWEAHFASKTSAPAERVDHERAA